MERLESHTGDHPGELASGMQLQETGKEECGLGAASQNKDPRSSAGLCGRADVRKEGRARRQDMIRETGWRDMPCT